MPIEFTCPKCGAAMTVEERFAGQTGPCRECGAIITIPGDAQSSAVYAPPAKKSGSGIWIAVGAVLCGLLFFGGILTALLLPAVSTARVAARRVQSQNNQKMIMLALLNYESAYGHFPPAYIADEEGNPMHSWRVLILPFLEEQNLYEQYNFDEPWDSPGNLAVVAQCPVVYQSPGDPASMGTTETNYLAIVGPNSVLAPPPAGMPEEDQRSKGGTKIATITDGTSRTICFVEEAATGVHWASPVDITLDESTNVNNTVNPGGYNAAYCDGHIEFIPTGSGVDLQSKATINDGK